MKRINIMTLALAALVMQQTYAVSDNAIAIGVGLTSGCISGALYTAGVPSYIAPLIPYAGLMALSKYTNKKINKPGVMLTTASITGSLIGGIRGINDAVELVSPEANSFVRSAPSEATAGIALVGGLVATIATIPAMYLYNMGSYAVGSFIPSVAAYYLWDNVTT